MKKYNLNDFLIQNKFYMNFIDTNFVFKLPDFKKFLYDINSMSCVYIKESSIDSSFVSFLLDIESQLLMSIYEDRHKHKFLWISSEDWYQLIYDFIFFLIDFVTWKRQFDTFMKYVNKK